MLINLRKFNNLRKLSFFSPLCHQPRSCVSPAGKKIVFFSALPVFRVSPLPSLWAVKFALFIVFLTIGQNLIQTYRKQSLHFFSTHHHQPGPHVKPAENKVCNFPVSSATCLDPMSCLQKVKFAFSSPPGYQSGPHVKLAESHVYIFQVLLVISPNPDPMPCLQKAKFAFSSPLGYQSGLHAKLVESNVYIFQVLPIISPSPDPVPWVQKAEFTFSQFS